MARGLVIAVLLLAAGTAWLWSDPTPVVPDGLHGAEAPDSAPGLRGRDIPDRSGTDTSSGIEDPVDYVLTELGRIPADERRTHLHGLIQQDPKFLQALVDWVGKPGHQTFARADLSTTATPEGTIYRTLALIGEPAVAPLVALFETGNADAACLAARALRVLGPRARDATSALTKAAADPEADRYVRAAAIDALGAIGPGTRDALALLHETLRDPEADEEVGLACARNLIRLGGTSEAVFETCRVLLAGDWYAATIVVLEELAGLGRAARPLLPSILRLHDEDTDQDALWMHVAPTLEAIGDDRDEVLVFLERMILTARRENVRDGGAARALAGLGARGQSILLDVARDGSDFEQFRSLQLLHWVGYDRTRLVGHVRDFLRDADPRSRAAGLLLLQQIGAPAVDVLPVLVLHLEDPDLRTRMAAVDVLGAVEAPNEAVRTFLQDAARDEHVALARVAITALGKHADTWPDRVLETFTEAAQRSDVQVARHALHALRTLVKVRRGGVLEAWHKALGDPRYFEVSVEALLAHAGRDPRTLAALRTLTASPDASRRAVAARGLGGAALSADFAALARLATDDAPTVRSVAVQGLGAYRGRHADQAVSMCLAALQDKDMHVRIAATQSLGRLGARAAKALPALRKQLAAQADTRRHLAVRLREAIDAITRATRRP